MERRNVFEAILETGHDEDFSPAPDEDFPATDAPAGCARENRRPGDARHARRAALAPGRSFRLQRSDRRRATPSLTRVSSSLEYYGTAEASCFCGPVCVSWIAALVCDR